MCIRGVIELNKKFKALAAILLIGLNVVIFSVTVKAESNTVGQLVDQAITQKSFYYYNIAYNEIMKLDRYWAKRCVTR